MISYKKIAILLAVVIIIVVGIYLVARAINNAPQTAQLNQNVNIEPEKTNENKNLNQNIVTAVKEYTLAIGEFDSQLLADGEVLVKSLKSVCGEAVSELALNVNNDQLFFYDANAGLGKAPQAIYSFNTQTLTCQKLDASQYLVGFSGRVLSATQKYLAVIPEQGAGNDRKIFVIDLAQDKVIKELGVANHLTLNAGAGVMDTAFQMGWSGDNVLKVMTYNMGTKTEAGVETFNIE